MQTNASLIIKVDQLRLGLYIHLDLGWMDHPFALSNFKLDDDAQIQKIKSIGLKTLRYDPKRSDCMPLPLVDKQFSKEAAQANTQDEGSEVPALSSVELKESKLKHLHRAIDESEKKFVIASETVKTIQRTILSAPKTCIEQASLLVNELVDTALMEGDVAIHALNGNRSSDNHYQHPLNVTVLTLLLAKSIQMSKEDARLLGIAAILHDIGKAEISDKILLKKDPLTQSELKHYQQHAEFGARMIKDLGLPARLGKIILQHHEFADGSGYPAGLSTEQTDPLARMIVLTSTYDRLCNPVNVELAKTPYEALAHLFAKLRNKFDEDLLKRLIKSLGVYPPGSIVKLSNNEYATVVSVNPNHPLRPYVLVHSHQDTEPQLMDLREEANLNVIHCLKPGQLPVDVLKRINLKKRVNYYLDQDPNSGSNA